MGEAPARAELRKAESSADAADAISQSSPEIALRLRSRIVQCGAMAPDLALPRGRRELSKHKHLADNLGTSSSIETQSVSEVTPKLKFEPLRHSVYLGRQRLGGYERVSVTLYAAHDALNRPLGRFARRRDAWSAVSQAASGAAQ